MMSESVVFVFGMLSPPPSIPTSQQFQCADVEKSQSSKRFLPIELSIVNNFNFPYLSWDSGRFKFPKIYNKFSIIVSTAVWISPIIATANLRSCFVGRQHGKRYFYIYRIHLYFRVTYHPVISGNTYIR